MSEVVARSSIMEKAQELVEKQVASKSHHPDVVIGADLTRNPPEAEVEDVEEETPTEEETPVEVESAEEPSEEAIEKPEELVEPEEAPAPPELSEEERKQLSEEDLDSMFAIGKVNGKEVEISLRELLNTQQTFEATKERLEAAKDIQRQYQEAFANLQEQAKSPAPEQPSTAQPDFEMMTEQDKQIYELQESVKGIRDLFQEREIAQLTSTEDSLIKERIANTLGDVPMENVSTLIQRVKTEDPAYGAIADELFSRGPADQADVQRRVAFFDALLQKAKSLEMPTIIEKVKEESKKAGAKEAVEKVKQNLVSTSGTDAPPTATRADAIQSAIASGGKVSDWAELVKTEIIQKRGGETK